MLNQGRSYGATGARAVGFGCQDELTGTADVDLDSNRTACRPRGRWHAFRQLLSKSTWLIGLYAPELGKSISRHKVDGIALGRRKS